MNLSWFTYFVLPPLYIKISYLLVRHFKYRAFKHRCFLWSLHKKDCPLLQNATVGSASQLRIIYRRPKDWVLFLDCLRVFSRTCLPVVTEPLEIVYRINSTLKAIGSFHVLSFSSFAGLCILYVRRKQERKLLTTKMKTLELGRRVCRYH